jgi:uncharacterized SAM-binding protein YcdF (DUF218 family)
VIEGVRRPASGGGRLLVVHGHRDGNAIGGEPAISEECLARVRVAEKVARRFGCRFVLLCGAGAVGHPSEARQMAATWRGPDLPLFLDERSSDTAENVREALAWIDVLGADELVVVSSWWHVRLRAYYAACRLRGIPVRYAWTRRCRRVASHLVHEVRYAPGAVRRIVGLGSRAS